MSSNVARPSSDNSPAGLGVMGSMSETCTPLKHRYDACFNKWFGDYLGASGAPGSDPSSSTSSSSSSSSPSSSSRSTGGFFGSKSARSDAKTEGENAGAGAGADAGVREKLREKYEKECGALFREYRECVRNAVKEKGLVDLISQARAENPFPFPHERKAGPNTPPFPFPAESSSD